MEPPTTTAPDQPADQFRPVASVPPPPPNAEDSDAPADRTPPPADPPPAPPAPPAPLAPGDGSFAAPPGPPNDPTVLVDPTEQLSAAEVAAAAVPSAPFSPPASAPGPPTPAPPDPTADGPRPRPAWSPLGWSRPAWSASAAHPNARVLLRAARPNQWTKNVLVFAAPGAAGILFHGRALWHTVVAFVLFCLVSSGTYLVNDAFDAEADRQDEVKRHRPVAAGLISIRNAAAVGGGLMLVGFAVGLLLRPQLGLVLAIYCLLQLAYSAYLKRRPIYDLTCVAGGFVLRAIAGAVAIPVSISEWFLIVTTFGSLLLVTGKRLAEKSELAGEPSPQRVTLDSYSLRFLRIVVSMSATGAVVGYALWAFGLQASAVAVHHHDGIFFQLSIVPVLLALLHFTLLIEQGRAVRPEEVILHDRELQLLGALWLLLFALGVYG